MCFLASSKLLPRTMTISLSHTPLQPSSSGQKLQSSDTPAITGRLTASDFIRHFLRSGLDLLQRQLVESHTAVIIPFNDRVIVVSLLNSADFSSRLSEVAQTLNAISGIQFLVGGSGFGERWLLGAV